MKRQFITLAVRIVLAFLYVPVALFSSAGTLDWPQAWAFILLLSLLGIGGLVIVHRKQPGLIDERKKFLKAEGIYYVKLKTIRNQIILGEKRKFGYACIGVNG